MFQNINLPEDTLPQDGRFGCGPTKVPFSHLDRLKENQYNLLGNSHRKPNVLNLVKRCQEKLRKYFSLPEDYEIILGNGGASIIWDMLAFSVVKEKSLHYTCGEFSNKCYTALDKAPWVEANKVVSENGHAPDFMVSMDADLVCITQNETSTGVMLDKTPDLKKEDNIVAVDATSIAGVTNWDWEKTDIYYFSLQKAFASEGGLYFAVVSPDFIKRVDEVENSGRYIPDMLSFSKVIANSKKHQTLNTPAISTLAFLDYSLDLLLEKGLEKITAESKEKANLIYDFAKAHNLLDPYIKNESDRSISVATIDVSDKIIATELTKKLRESNIFDIDSYRKLNRNQIRIGLFPFIEKDDLEKLTKCITYLFDQVDI